MSKTEHYSVEKTYVGGYQDGTVSIWDATLPVLSHIALLKFEVSAVLAVNPVRVSDFVWVNCKTIPIGKKANSQVVLL